MRLKFLEVPGYEIECTEIPDYLLSYYDSTNANSKSEFSGIPTEEELLADELLEVEEMETAHRKSLEGQGFFLSDNMKENSLAVYPNPGKGAFSLQAGSDVIHIV